MKYLSFPPFLSPTIDSPLLKQASPLIASSVHAVDIVELETQYIPKLTCSFPKGTVSVVTGAQEQTREAVLEAIISGGQNGRVDVFGIEVGPGNAVCPGPGVCHASWQSADNPAVSLRMHCTTLASLLGMDKTSMNERIAYAARIVCMERQLDVPCGELSAHGRACVSLAGALTISAPLTLISEGLLEIQPLQLQRRIVGAFAANCSERGHTAIIASADFGVIKQAEHTLLLGDGGIKVSEGPSQYLTRDVRLLDARGIQTDEEEAMESEDIMSRPRASIAVSPPLRRCHLTAKRSIGRRWLPRLRPALVLAAESSHTRVMYTLLSLIVPCFLGILLVTISKPSPDVVAIVNLDNGLNGTGTAKMSELCIRSIERTVDRTYRTTIRVARRDLELGSAGCVLTIPLSFTRGLIRDGKDHNPILTCRNGFSMQRVSKNVDDCLNTLGMEFQTASGGVQAVSKEGFSVKSIYYPLVFVSSLLFSYSVSDARTKSIARVAGVTRGELMISKTLLGLFFSFSQHMFLFPILLFTFDSLLSALVFSVLVALTGCMCGAVAASLSKHRRPGKLAVASDVTVCLLLLFTILVCVPSTRAPVRWARMIHPASVAQKAVISLSSRVSIFPSVLVLFITWIIFTAVSVVLGLDN